MTNLGEPRELTGTRQQVSQALAKLDAAGLVAAFSPPEPHQHGCRVWWWMRQPAHRSQVRQLPPGSRPAWSPRDLTPGQRRAIAGGAMFVGAGGVLAGFVWLIVRAVSGAVNAATGNPALAILAVLALVIGGLKWLTRERGPSSSGGGSCPGITCHCQGCQDHR